MQKTHNLIIDQKKYKVSVHQSTPNDPHSIKILIPIYIRSKDGYQIAAACIESVKKHTKEKHEIWVIDNNSKNRFTKKIKAIQDISFIQNHTEPINHRLIQKNKKRVIPFIQSKTQLADGSYANAIGLEIGTRIINQETKYVLTLHSDTIATRDNWLSHLLHPLNNNTKASAFFSDNSRVKALHVSGLLFDFQLYRTLNINLLPNINQLLNKNIPEYDVGDLISIVFKQNNYKLYCCNNTQNESKKFIPPEIMNSLPIQSACAFDDSNNIIFIHLGRGTPKSIKKYKKKNKTTPKEWIEFAQKIRA